MIGINTSTHSTSTIHTSNSHEEDRNDNLHNLLFRAILGNLLGRFEMIEHEIMNLGDDSNEDDEETKKETVDDAIKKGYIPKLDDSNDNKSDEKLETCILCCSEERSVYAEPCMHSPCCTKCLHSFIGTNNIRSYCMICKQKVDKYNLITKDMMGKIIFN